MSRGIERDWDKDSLLLLVKEAHDKDLEKCVIRSFEKAAGLPEGILGE